jgi:hypothetical protein
VARRGSLTKGKNPETIGDSYDMPGMSQRIGNRSPHERLLAMHELISPQGDNIGNIEHLRQQGCSDAVRKPKMSVEKIDRPLAVEVLHVRKKPSEHCHAVDPGPPRWINPFHIADLDAVLAGYARKRLAPSEFTLLAGVVKNADRDHDMHVVVFRKSSLACLDEHPERRLIGVRVNRRDRDDVKPAHTASSLRARRRSAASLYNSSISSLCSFMPLRRVDR